MRRVRPQEEEEIRLQNSTELMYGNKDTEQSYPFDVAAKYRYLIFHEVVGFTEDGQTYSKKTTQRYSHYSISQFENLKRTDWFKRRKITYTILHDPILQAKEDGVSLAGATTKGLTLAQKLAKINESKDQSEPKVAKRPANRKEVVDNE